MDIECYPSMGNTTDDLNLFISHVTYVDTKAFCQEFGYNLGFVNVGQGIAIRCFTEVSDGTKTHDYNIQMFVNWLKIQEIKKEVI